MKKYLILFCCFLFIIANQTLAQNNEESGTLINQILEVEKQQREIVKNVNFDAEYIEGEEKDGGPRPHAVVHNEYYRKRIKGYMLRHKVKPGITGLAQVKGFRGETDTLDKMEGRIHYDLKYIQNWTLSMDIQIITLTLIKGFSGDTVY